MAVRVAVLLGAAVLGAEAVPSLVVQPAPEPPQLRQCVVSQDERHTLALPMISARLARTKSARTRTSMVRSTTCCSH